MIPKDLISTILVTSCIIYVIGIFPAYCIGRYKAEKNHILPYGGLFYGAELGFSIVWPLFVFSYCLGQIADLIFWVLGFFVKRLNVIVDDYVLPTMIRFFGRCKEIYNDIKGY